MLERGGGAPRLPPPAPSGIGQPLLCAVFSHCRNTYKGGDLVEASSSLDWGANLAHMMGEGVGGRVK